MARTWFIERLELSNYRCFEHVELTFEPDVTVLIGRNSSGKSAVLDALAVMLGTVVREFKGVGPGFDRWDATAVPQDLGSTASVAQIEQQYPVRGKVRATLSGRSFGWSRARGSESGRTTWAQNSASRFVAGLARDARAARGPDPIVPVIANYGVERLLLQRKNTGPFPTSRLAAFEATLDRRSDLNRLTPFLAGLTTQVVVAQARREPPPAAAEAQLAFIDEACTTALAGTGWSNPQWDLTLKRLTLRHPRHGVLPLDILASGIRIAAGLVIDLASRAARANPHLGADDLRRVPGIVLVDEVDLHLHPEWQQRIVPSLTESFPCIQFILTTHSPQVLSTVEARQIRDLELPSDTDHQPQHSRGLRSDVVLREVMGVRAEPPQTPEREELERYLEMVHSGRGRSPEAIDLRKRIEFAMGGTVTVPELAEVDALLTFEALEDE